MVRIGSSLLRLLAVVICFPLFGDVQLVVSIDEDSVGVDVPINGVIRVSYEKGQELDPDSFEMEGRPLAVKFLGEGQQRSVRIINGVREDSTLIVANYQFTLPGKPEGVHLLPPIKVRVDGVQYASKTTTYAIQLAESSTSFRLEASVDGRTPIYPGQRIKFVYRMIFRENIELTQQFLPLLQAEGFRRVGDTKVQRLSQGKEYVQEMVQEVEAVNPGNYSFGPSIAEGYRYREDWFGRKHLARPRLRAEAPAVVVAVQPFPQQGRPDLFEGAVGEFSMRVRMLTPNELAVGDKIQLELLISGPGEYHTVQSPDFSRQPDFMQSFRLSDIPPGGEQLQSSKRFLIDLRPLDAEMTEIPPIHFAFFNPREQRYVELSSDPIPVRISELATEDWEEELPTFEEEPVRGDEPNLDRPEEREERRLPRIAIQGNYRLQAEDLRPQFLTSWKALWIIPVGFLLLLIELLIHHYRQQASEEKPRDSRSYIEDAEEAIEQPDRLFALLERALLHRLYETGAVKTKVLSGADLEGEGVVQEVKEWLIQVEAKRYGGAGQISPKSALKEARELFNRIR